MHRKFLILFVILFLYGCAPVTYKESDNADTDQRYARIVTDSFDTDHGFTRIYDNKLFILDVDGESHWQLCYPVIVCYPEEIYISAGEHSLKWRYRNYQEYAHGYITVNLSPGKSYIFKKERLDKRKVRVWIEGESNSGIEADSEEKLPGSIDVTE